jgi:hypothetical protein
MRARSAPARVTGGERQFGQVIGTTDLVLTVRHNGQGLLRRLSKSVITIR